MSGSRGSPSSIPVRGDPDRKRVLNVLAQRRYRQRKRERMLALEGKRRAIDTSPDVQNQTGTSAGVEMLPTPEEDEETPQSNLSATRTAVPGAPSSTDSTVDVVASAMPVGGWSDIANSWAGGMDGDFRDSPWHSENDFFEGFGPATLDTALPPSDADLGQELHTLESLQFTFPDDAELDVPVLKVLKVGFSIAQLLGCEHTIWDLNASRVFDAAQMPALTLPRSFEPTEVQKRIPHHPLFDILPWPAIRTKLICVFAQPVHLRPPAARDPLALLHMLYDIDDSAEGFRIANGDGFDGGSWEVGQAFFRNWWWALDRAVVEHSNALRAERGADRLQLLPA